MIILLSKPRDTTALRIGSYLTLMGEEWAILDPSLIPLNAMVTCRLEKGERPRYMVKTQEEIFDLRSCKSIWFWHYDQPKLDDIGDANVRRWMRLESVSAMDGIWSSLDCFWVSSPHRVIEAQYKPYNLKKAYEVGFKIPKTLITNDPDLFLDFMNECDGKVISKPIMQTNFEYKGANYMIYTKKISKNDIRRFQSVKLSPVIFQEYVDKKLEVRVTIVGDKVFAAEIHSQRSPLSRVDWRRYDLDNTPYFIHKLPEEVHEECLTLMRELGLRYCAIDLILKPDGSYVYLEVNPVGQFGWIEDLTGMKITESVAKLLAHSG